MNVLLLSPEMNSIGGIQRYNRLMVAAIDKYVAANNGELLILCLNDVPPKHLHPELSNLKATKISHFSGNQFSYIYNFAKSINKASIVIYGLLGFSVLSPIQYLLGSKAVKLQMLYGIEAWHHRSQFHATGLRHMQFFVSISQYTLDTFYKAYKFSNNYSSVVIPNPVTPDLLATATTIYDESKENSPRLLSVTRLANTEKPKGIDTVIEALPLILRQFPNLIYVIVGDGEDRERLERISIDLGVKDSVHFLGFVSEDKLKIEFANCDIFVMPSNKEGFGFVFIEAMAYGKPVVAARAGATPEVVEHNQTGLLVKYGDIYELATAISKLLGNKDLQIRFGATARDTVAMKYTFDNFYNRWELLLSKIQKDSELT